MKKKTYNTDGRKRLTAFFAQNPDRQFTADELCLALNEGHLQKRSSIYRYLGELCSADTVRKFRNEERHCSVYQYVGDQCDCRSHFHAKCLLCGSICHLECDDSIAFAAHLQNEHGFAVDCGQSLLYGVCAACKHAKEEAHP